MLKKLKKSLDIKNKEVVDIVLFGSAVKGKVFVGDVDVCIIFRENILDMVVKEVEEKIKKLGLKPHMSILKVDNFFRKPVSLIRTILREGISILTGRKISDIYGLDGYSLYSYSLVGMKPNEKVRFVYIVKGRKNEKGFIEKIKGEWLNDGCFIIPIEKDSDILELFKKWNVKYTKKNILLMS